MKACDACADHKEKPPSPGVRTHPETCRFKDIIHSEIHLHARLLAHTLCGMQQIIHFPRLRELRANQAQRPSFDSRGKK